MELTCIVSVIVGTVVFVVQTHAVIWEADMPNLLKQCYEEHTHDLTSDVPSHDIHTYCLGKFIWQIPNVQGKFNMTENEINHIKSAYREFQQNLNSTRRHKRQAQRALRRELRVLSDEERQRFFNALNTLKENKFYDAWAKVHSNSIVLDSAHGGPNFLGYHRVYLLFLEFKLQEVDSSVSLCYWDSSMDNDMERPHETAMFTSQLVGNGMGQVINGPFAGWRVDLNNDTMSLKRNISQIKSSLMVKSRMKRFLEGNEAIRHSDVVMGFRSHRLDTIEGHHGNVHNWVGGAMADAVIAAFDPVFILHHTFIDYIWEKFRQKIRQQGVNPSTDYPWPMHNVLHRPDNTMYMYDNYTNLDGYSDMFTQDYYHYEDMPSCETNCGNSRFLTCRRGVCVSLTACDIGEESSAEVMSSLSSFGISFDLLQRPVVAPFETVFVDPRTGPRSMAALIGPRTGNFRNCENINHRSRESLALPLNGMQRVNGGIGQVHLNGARTLTNIRNSARTRTTSFKNVGGISRTNVKNMRLRNLIPPYNPIRHLWDQSLRFNAFQKSNPARNFPLASNIHSMIHLPNLPIQNTFKMDGVFDKRRWVYIPVRIIYTRRPKQYIGPVYKSPLSIHKSKYPPQINPLFSILPKKTPATFPGCLKNPDRFSKVFVQSNGFSYRGQYLDYAVFDNRHPVSKSIVYVAVKNPNLGVTQSYLTAFDSCGRVCRPRCLIRGSNPPAYRPCSGVVNISSRLPLMYGRTYGEAFKRRRSFAVKRCPSCFHGEIFITFHCNSGNALPWKGSSGRILRKFK